MRFIAILCILLQSVLSLQGSPNTATAVADSLVLRVAGLSAGKMVDMADSLTETDDKEDAVSLYMTVSQRTVGVDDETTAVYRIRGFIGVGDILMKRCDYAGAMDNYVKALLISEAFPSRPFAATIHKNIGNVYCCLYDYESGVSSYLQGLEECREHPDKVVEKKLLSNLAGMLTYTSSGGGADAVEYLAALRRLSPPVTGDEIFLDSFLDGLVSRSSGQPLRAVAKFRDAALKADSLGIEPRYICSAYQELYTTYKQLGRPDSSLWYMQACLDTACKQGILRMFPSVLGALSDYYQEVGRGELAREYRARYLDLRDSIINERDFNAVKNVLFQHNAAATAGEINELHRQKTEKEEIIRRQKIALWSGLAGFMAVCGVLIVFYVQKRKITRSYHRLYEMGREYAVAERRMSQRHKSDLMLIEQREQEINLLTGGNVGEVQNVEAPVVGEGASQVKYSTSNLGEQQRGKLAEAITAVMEEQTGEYCNPEFSLATLARLVGSNAKYVSQTIHEEFNRNFNTYVNHYRVKLACERLSDRDFDSYKIKYIGESVGFKSQTTFTEVFRKHTGLSPSVYRRISIEENGGEDSPQ